jgi:glycosyltransferase involved in cell wall biosynthesis
MVLEVWMRILILTPTALPCITGNAVTAERWLRSLGNLGQEVKVVATHGLNSEGLAERIRAFSPDVLHAHHAFRAGGRLLEAPVAEAWGGRPLVVSPAGTDIYLDAANHESRAVVVEVFRRAGAIVVQNEVTGWAAQPLISDAAKRISLVPKAFLWLGDDAFDLRCAAGAGPEHVVFFHPAGVRPVKGNLECLRAMEEVVASRPLVRCVFAGPILDDEYGVRFVREVERLRSFACWMSSIPAEAMRAAYGGADVVLNTSRAEGLSNALVEATAAHKPVLVSDVPGNRCHVARSDAESPSGLFYDPADPTDFGRQVLKLTDDASLRAEMARAAREREARWPSPEVEATALLRVYRQVMGSSAPAHSGSRRTWQEQLGI